MLPQCNKSMYNQDQKTKRRDKDEVKGRLYWIKGNRWVLRFDLEMATELQAVP